VGTANPSLVVMAGPNGAGKSTAAPLLLPRELSITEYVNADVIARGLSAFNPDQAAFEAGRIMLRRLRELAGRRENFAFETTLAGRHYAPWIEDLCRQGYSFHLIYLWLPTSHFARQRVAGRVQEGGHDVPGEVIERRYLAGLKNFFQLYRPLAESWHFYDNSGDSGPRLLARGGSRSGEEILDAVTWAEVRKGVGNG
jgi:predicted ABC-type ATPase